MELLLAKDYSKAHMKRIGQGESHYQIWEAFTRPQNENMLPK